MNNKVHFWTCTFFGVFVLINFWMTCNNTHDIHQLQEKQLIDSVNNLRNLNITIKYVLPNDTSTISESE